jgi:hypothetical protein
MTSCAGRLGKKKDRADHAFAVSHWTLRVNSGMIFRKHGVTAESMG